ncbi:MAG: helix-turn-helix domain-containing protein [Bacteroidales bacterium]|nr:helix-turn-helix domain-containing protein [Bacteroidales bacterium]
MNFKFSDHEKTDYELADLKTYFGLVNGKTVAPPPSGDLHSLIRQQALEITELKKQILDLQAALTRKPEATWITTKEVLEILPVCKRTLQNYRYDQVIPFKKIRGKIYYRKKDVIEFRESSI